MGYTNYWHRPEKLNESKFKLFSDDARKLIDYCMNELGIDLDGCGFSHPVITDEQVRFNGSDRQRVGMWTTTEQLVLPWFSKKASLIAEITDPTQDKRDGTWHSGDLVKQRVAPIDNLTGLGCGSYETFLIEQCEPRYSKGEGESFNFCKTSCRPYDLTVTAVLIAFKYYFPNLKVHTDGEDKDWFDGKVLCNNLLGYGMEYQINEKGVLVKSKTKQQ